MPQRGGRASIYPATVPAARPQLRRDDLAAIGFVVALWLLASGALYGFALGRHSDDWAYNLRSPDGSHLASPFVRYDYFFRPLFFIAAYGVNSLGGEGAWPAHGLLALAHLAAALLLYRLLRTLHVGAGAAGLGAALFTCWDLQHQAVLWSAALGLPAGMAVAALTMLAAVRLARDGGPSARLSAGRTLGWMGLLALGAFVSACWHEQPAAAACAAPLVMLAARPPGQAWTVALRRAMLAGAGLGAGCLAYAALLVGTTPRGSRGSGSSLVPVADLPARAEGVLNATLDLAFGPRAAERTASALQAGQTLLQSSGPGVALVALVAVAGAAWIAYAWRLAPRPGAAPGAAAAGPAGRPRLLLLAVAGLAMTALGLLPVALVRNNAVFARYAYPAVFGLALAAAPIVNMLDAPGHGGPLRRLGRIVALAAAAAGLLAFATAMVGMQAAFRARDALDRSIGAQLRALVPSPPPGAVFVPVDLRDASPTGRGYDRSIPGPLHLPWAAAPFIARTYGRDDLSATHWHFAQRPPVSIGPDGVEYPRALRDCWARPRPDRTLVPLDRAVLFTLDERGGVRLLTADEARELIRGASR